MRRCVKNTAFKRFVLLLRLQHNVYYVVKIQLRRPVGEKKYGKRKMAGLCMRKKEKAG